MLKFLSVNKEKAAESDDGRVAPEGAAGQAAASGQDGASSKQRAEDAGDGAGDDFATRLNKVTTLVGSVGFVLVAVALLFTQLAFFPFFSDDINLCFNSLIYFAPFVGAATFMRPRPYFLTSAALGVVLSIHAHLMPLDYFEMQFTNPVYAVMLTLAGALVIWLFVRGAFRLRTRLGWDRAGVVKRELPLVAGAMLAALFVTIPTTTFLSAAFLFASDISVQNLWNLGVLSVQRPSEWLGALVNGVVWSACALFVDVCLRKWFARPAALPLKTMFKRWLLVVVAVAFLITTTIGYYGATRRCMDQARSNLEGQLRYLKSQVSLQASRLETIKQSEKDRMASIARFTAAILSDQDDYYKDAAYAEEIRDDLGLLTITVCDTTGLVVVDTDGQGIGTYNFANHELTKPYMELLNGKDSLVEEPRNAVLPDGTTGNEIREYAGAPLENGKGFVQVSVDGAEYTAALANASLDHLVDSYTLGQEGTVFVAQGDTIISSNDEKLRGTSVNKFFTGIESSEMDLASYWIDGTIQRMQDFETTSISYGIGDTESGYRIFLLDTSDDIFAVRTTTLMWDVMLYAILLGAVYLFTSVLLEHAVVRGFKRTNVGLKKITEGDLEQRIDERASNEFLSLSEGINTTVDTLKGLIGEAEARMEHDMLTARTIQESALPRTFPPFPEIEAFDLYASMNAAKQVGGDFYNFFLIDEHTLGFLIADVSGKGIPGALFMMAAKTVIENYMSTGMPLAEAIQTANHQLCANNDAGMFVTVWAATLDWETGLLTYVNAGHNFPLLRHGRGGSWEWLNQKCGLFLGTFDIAKYRSRTLTLEPGDELLLYTDGVNEAFSMDEEEYGNERLEAFLSAHTKMRPRGLVEALRRDVAKWAKGAEQSDDITILALEYGVAPEVTGSITVTAQSDQLDRVVSMIHAELTKRLCPINVQNYLDVALEELFINVCAYAYADADEPGEVTVNYVYTADPRCMTIEIRDSGMPFDPLDVKDVERPVSLENAGKNGLGIMMARQSVDEISYKYKNGVNRVTFSKRW